jgi:hypothetical protein
VQINKQSKTFSVIKLQAEAGPYGWGGGSSSLDQLQKKLDDAKAAYEQGKIDFSNNSISQAQLLDLEKAYSKAEDELKSAQKAQGSKDVMPDCVLAHPIDGTFTGCIAQMVYYVLFVPTSYLFSLAGIFFDNTFHYSIQDKSYSTSFVTGGWGMVRDFCNIFFIFVLLYIAFRTILGMGGGHGPNTKQMIINVIIIGLLINFSLFAAQLIVDSSNILARVFYNSGTIKTIEEVDGADSIISQPGPNGEMQLSAAIVSKVDPQNLIINSQKVSDIEDKGGQGGGESLSAGTFLLVTLLATAVNVVGMIVFLSVGLIFVARVIGLWVAMILSPLAFFSYTVPSMQGMNLVGWKHWWPETISLAFLAPIFMFFLYLILKFLTVIDIITINNESSGAAFVIQVIMPFAFIMILMLRAKSVAKDMSGKLGQSITGGVAAVGGLALGGAALGAAFAGRNILGRGMAAMSKTDGAKAMVKYRQDLKDYNSGKTNVAPVKPKINFISKIGDTLNRKQEKVNEVDHARHEMDSIKDKAGLKGVDDHNLSGVDVQKMQTTFTKEKKSEIESDIRKGASPLVDATGQPIKDTNGNVITGGESGYKSAMRNQVYTSMNINQNTATDSEKKKVEDELNIRFNAVLKTSTDKESANRFNHLRDESKQKVNPYDRVVARSNKGSYDIRNLSQTKVDKREGIFTRMGAGLIAGVAMGVRTGLKNSNINHGSGQSDILKDLGHTITEALKSAQFNVKVESSHGKSSDDHGGGGHH